MIGNQIRRNRLPGTSRSSAQLNCTLCASQRTT